MAYQALYRKYRSQTFEDIIGQEAVTRTLRNAIMQNKISHAYLFDGPRGTGKTSCAKIFAKAINCPNQHDGEPCNHCEICQEITNGSASDVIEIDAASNNGVDEIREIREKVKYAPTKLKYKVYIIDEVHMLSKGAFNALLKTLEEPPKHVVFILATTEPHKIPATIISRVQRFDFKRISTADIEAHLASVLADLQITYDNQALEVVARVAEGGMRDALSILDQVLAFSNQGKITLSDALSVTGSLTTEFMLEFLQQCKKKDNAAALVLIQKLIAEGKEASRIIEDLLIFVRDILIYKQTKQLPMTVINLQEFEQLSETLTTSILYQYIDILVKTKNDLRLNQHQTIYLEVMAIKLTEVQDEIIEHQQIDVNSKVIKTLNEKIALLEAQIQKLQQSQVTTISTTAAITSAKGQTRFESNQDQIEIILMEAKRNYLTEIQEAWPEILDVLNEYQRILLQPSHVRPVAASEEGVVLAEKVEVFAKRLVTDEQAMQSLEQALFKILGRDIHVELVLDSEWIKVRQTFLARRKQVQEGVLEHAESNNNNEVDNQIVDKAKDLFGSIVEVVDD